MSVGDFVSLAGLVLASFAAGFTVGYWKAVRG